jgi:predicted Zn-dependent protease
VIANDAIARLRAQLDGPRDGALLRFGLAQALMTQGDAAAAIEHLQRAVVFDPRYSAAWKLLGQALVALQRHDEAIVAYGRGIDVAQARGDKQAAKEMAVFLKRLQRAEQP